MEAGEVPLSLSLCALRAPICDFQMHVFDTTSKFPSLQPSPLVLHFR